MSFGIQSKHISTTEAWKSCKQRIHSSLSSSTRNFIVVAALKWKSSERFFTNSVGVSRFIVRNSFRNGPSINPRLLQKYELIYCTYVNYINRSANNIMYCRKLYFCGMQSYNETDFSHCAAWLTSHSARDCFL